MINSNNTQLNSDYDHSMLRKWALGNKGGILKQSDFVFDKEGGIISAGSEIAEAVILCKRTTSYPIGNQTFLAHFQFTGNVENLPTSNGTKIFIEIKENLILDPSLISDADGRSEYAKGFGIGEIKAAQSWPSHQNYLPLWEIEGGHAVDRRSFVSLPALDSVAQRTTSLEQKMETQEQKVERLETGGQTNFAVERELGENIEAGKCYFLAEGVVDTRTIEENAEDSRTTVLIPKISGPKPPYKQNIHGTEFVDGEYKWVINEIPYGNNFDNNFFKNDPSLIYRDGGSPRRMGGGNDRITIVLSRIDQQAFFLNYIKLIDNFLNVQIHGIKGTGEEVLIETHRNNTNPSDIFYEFRNNKGLYQKFKIFISSSQSTYTTMQIKGIGTTVKHKKTINIDNPASVIPLRKGDYLDVVVNKVGNGASLLLSGMLNKTITATTERLQHYCDRDGYIILMVQNPTSNSYFTIGDLTITRGGTAGKKYRSDSSIDWRNKFQGIEKKGGTKGQRTHGIEQGIIEMQGKADGEYFLGENGEIVKDGNGVMIGEIKGSYLNTNPQKQKKIIINKKIEGRASAQWTSPGNGLLFFSYNISTGGSGWGIIDGYKFRGLSNTPSQIYVERGQTINFSVDDNYRSGTYKIELLYFIPLS